MWSIVWLVPSPSRVRHSMCTPVIPAVPYLLLGFQDVQWAVRNSRGARKLIRIPHVNNNKNNNNNYGFLEIDSNSILTSFTRLSCNISIHASNFCTSYITNGRLQLFLKLIPWRLSILISRLFGCVFQPVFC
jgi:hypothetical protein